MKSVKSISYNKTLGPVDFPCRASGEEIGPNRSTSGFDCFKMIFPLRSKKNHSDLGKDYDSAISGFQTSPVPPRKITPSGFLLHLSDFQRVHLSCAPREFTAPGLLLYEIDFPRSRK